MPHDLHDTLVALSSAPGPGARAVVRLSGPDALRIAFTLFTAAEPVLPHRRRCYPGELRLPGVAAPLPADLYAWPAPRTYTGQNLVELHTLSSPPLVELLVARLLDAGARAAGPGEFTLRAFLAGKLDLTQAEAVLGVIEAGSRAALQEALAQLAGGVTRPLQELRGDLLDLLADVEAGLDFADEDIHFVGQEELLGRISKGLALVTLLGKQLEQRSLSGATFRAVLAGRPNAGKSSLFNALAGAAALISPEPGTTRDYLVRRLDLGGVPVELVDTAGWQESADAVGQQAQALGRDQAGRADLVLLCLEAGRPPDEAEAALLRAQAPPALAVATKCDLAEPPPGVLATSAVTGAGLDALRELLAERARGHARPPLAPSLSRCRHHVEACLAHLRQAHAVALFQEPPELLALELRGALDQLGEMVGAVYTDDLLDRIFSRFCIGK
jgi:tRNA modification GTPase